MKLKYAFLVIYAAIGIGLSQTIYSILLSDLTFLPLPTTNFLLAPLVIPFLFLLIPTLIVFITYFFVTKALGSRAGIILLVVVIAIGTTLWLMRIYFLKTSSALDSIIVLVMVFVSVIGLSVFFWKYIVRVFLLVSFIVTLSTIHFIYQGYKEYELSKVEIEATNDERFAAIDIVDNNELSTPVVHIIFDELSGILLRSREKTIDATLFPHLASLAETSTWYPNYTTFISSTTPNIISMMSGVSPVGRKKFTKSTLSTIPTIHAGLSAYVPIKIWETRNALDHEKTIEIARHISWKFYTHIVLLAYCSGVFSSSWVDVPDLQLLAAMPTPWSAKSQKAFKESYLSYVDSFLTSLKLREANIYLFYSILPHHPYFLNPDGSLIVVHPVKDGVPARAKKFFHPNDAIGRGETSYNIYRSYINQSRFIDSIVGRVINLMKDIGLFERSLIIVMSDHGTGYNDTAPGRLPNKRFHGEQKMQAQMMNLVPPLIIKYPKQKEKNVSTIYARPYDIAATIADVLGVKSSWDMDGTSLRDKNFPGRNRFFGDVDPFDYEIKVKSPETIESSLIGKSTEDLSVVMRGGGTLFNISYERALPGDSNCDYVLTLDGFSLFRNPKMLPEISLISVNDIIVKAVRPSQYYKNEKVCSKWTVRIPANALRVGRNSINAFSLYDKARDTYAKFNKSYKFDLSPDMIAGLTKKSLKTNNKQ